MAKRKSMTYSRGRLVPRGEVLSGARLYVRGATVNQVKRAVGKLAKRVRLGGDGSVEVIHTHNGLGPSTRRPRPGLFKLLGAVRDLGL